MDRPSSFLEAGPGSESLGMACVTACVPCFRQDKVPEGSGVGFVLALHVRRFSECQPHRSRVLKPKEPRGKVYNACHGVPELWSPGGLCQHPSSCLHKPKIGSISDLSFLSAVGSFFYHYFKREGQIVQVNKCSRKTMFSNVVSKPFLEKETLYKMYQKLC